MQPHHAIETMVKLGTRAPEWHPGAPVREVAQLLARAVTFNFGSIRPDDEHTAFALDMFERGLFRMPFDLCAFSLTGVADGAFETGRKTSTLLVVGQRDDGSLTTVQCAEMLDEGRRAGVIPTGILMDGQAKRVGGPTQAEVVATAYPMLNDRINAIMYSGPDPVETMRQRMMANLVIAMGLTVMLMSQGVSVDHEPPPEKLNAKRERKGKPQIRDRYTVRLTLASTYTINTEGGEEDITGHRRGAPRPHWRRGHFRTLGRGSEQERVIPVAPALIGASDESAVARKMYEMVRPAGAAVN